MATFGIAVSEQQKEQLDKALNALAVEGEKKSDTLARICAFALDGLERQRLSDAGLDVKGLELAIATIKALFAAQIAAREQVEASTMERVRAEAVKSRAAIDALTEQLRDAKADADDLRQQLAAVRAESERKDKEIADYRRTADMAESLIRASVEVAVSRAAPAMQARISALEALLKENGVDVPVESYYDATKEQ